MALRYIIAIIITWISNDHILDEMLPPGLPVQRSFQGMDLTPLPDEIKNSFSASAQCCLVAHNMIK